MDQESILQELHFRQKEQVVATVKTKPWPQLHGQASLPWSTTASVLKLRWQILFLVSGFWLFVQNTVRLVVCASHAFQDEHCLQKKKNCIQLKQHILFVKDGSSKIDHK